MTRRNSPDISQQIVNDPGWFRRLLEKLRGRPVEYDLSPYLDRLQQINDREPALRILSDYELKALASNLRNSSQAPLVDVYALVREGARRTLGMRHFDVQIIGGIALHQGKLVEMETGEGKTLVAVLPAALNALCGNGVHILTFNDYLARRDAEWMGPIYEFMGLSVSFIHPGMTSAERRAAYRADITYLTAKEAGFDYLRDGLCYSSDERVQRPFHFAIVDEADSILIDEARIPLIIAGEREEQAHNATRLAAIARVLEPGIHYEISEKRRNVYLTEEGVERVAIETGCGDLHNPDNASWLTEINLAIHARALLHRDIDYIVRDGTVEHVDEYTGRAIQDRHWPDGLQTAIEAKEGLRFGKEGMILGTITLQHYFGLYPKLAGMTATARPEEEEFKEFYGLTTIVLPTNKPCNRRDRPDSIFTHREAKSNAIVQKVIEARQSGRPVLVGTASVRESEELAALLASKGLECNVLNARTDAMEAGIIAEAGAAGALTISTNMAGRGTDIRLGGADQRDHRQVVNAGGLLVIGTNRHESRRIDKQLRGRAGRQGDPGSSEFFISLEDEIMVRYGIDEMLPEMHRRQRNESLDDPLVRHRINAAQRTIEGQHMDVRKMLWAFSSYTEGQRRHIREIRDNMLHEDSKASLWNEARPERYTELIQALGKDRATHLERTVSLHCIDQLWADYLSYIGELRERIHIVRLANMTPFDEFVRESSEAYQDLLNQIDDRILDVFDRMEISEDGIDLKLLGIRRPSATWTYLIDDNPFRDAMGMHISGDLGLSIAAAVYGPIYIVFSLYRRFFSRKAGKQD
ncbi:MAG: accessory Sec system translocase SecA2 [Acidobacteria bacterium]|nr:accessory Sec system translocase SecA2 [Acidobacteriota bacterium]